MSSFGSRFKGLRLMRDLTQDALAADFNSKYGYLFTKSAISQYENDKRLPEINVLINFAEYFNVSVDYLLSGDSVKEGKSQYMNLAAAETGIDLEELASILKLLLKNRVVTFNEKSLSKEDLSLFTNCIEIGVELIKKRSS